MNKKNMVGIILIILVGVAIGAFGQILIKIGLQQVGNIEMRGINSVIPAIFKMVTNKFVFLGLFLSAIAALFWLGALSRIDLSFGYPLAGGLFYIAVIIMSVIILKEKISIAQLIGTSIILLGVIILAKFRN